MEDVGVTLLLQEGLDGISADTTQLQQKQNTEVFHQEQQFGGVIQPIFLTPKQLCLHHAWILSYY